jgi:hypothetical protein
MVCSNDTASVTRPVFSEYVTDVILPYFATTRESLNLGNLPRVLLLDNRRSHIGEEVKRFLVQHHITLITFPPHVADVSVTRSRQVCGVRTRETGGTY